MCDIVLYWLRKTPRPTVPWPQSCTAEGLSEKVSEFWNQFLQMRDSKPGRRPSTSTPPIDAFSEAVITHLFGMHMAPPSAPPGLGEVATVGSNPQAPIATAADTPLAFPAITPYQVFKWLTNDLMSEIHESIVTEWVNTIADHSNAKTRLVAECLLRQPLQVNVSVSDPESSQPAALPMTSLTIADGINSALLKVIRTALPPGSLDVFSDARIKAILASDDAPRLCKAGQQLASDIATGRNIQPSKYSEQSGSVSLPLSPLLRLSSPLDTPSFIVSRLSSTLAQRGVCMTINGVDLSGTVDGTSTSYHGQCWKSHIVIVTSTQGLERVHQELLLLPVAPSDLNRSVLILTCTAVGDCQISSPGTCASPVAVSTAAAPPIASPARADASSRVRDGVSVSYPPKASTTYSPDGATISTFNLSIPGEIDDLRLNLYIAVTKGGSVILRYDASTTDADVESLFCVFFVSKLSMHSHSVYDGVCIAGSASSLNEDGYG